MAQEWSESQLKWYDRHNKARPTHISHGVNTEDLDAHMKQLMPNTWRLEGNTLIGETEMGPLVQQIDPEYILSGTDEKGLPIFTKVVLSK
jgi:hypothetical protein